MMVAWLTHKVTEPWELWLYLALIVLSIGSNVADMIIRRRQRNEARKHAEHWMERALDAEKQKAGAAELHRILTRSYNHRVKELEDRANKWQSKHQALAVQLALLPERDPKTGRYVHREDV